MRRIFKTLIGFVAGTICVCVSMASGQVPGQTNQSTSSVILQPQASPSPSPSRSVEEGRPLYGFQGVLVETLSGKVVASQLPDQQFNPASAVKLATSLIALRTLGPQHRFATGVWTDGLLDKSTGTITGNLYVSGRDPSFHYEHAVLLASELNRLGITKVTGDLIVAPSFTMNFSSSASRSGERLYDTLDSSLRYAEATRAWNYERTLLNDQTSLQTVPSIAVMGSVVVGPVSTGAKLLLTQKSSKLVDILKVLLCYSNNFMAERIGESLGGPDAVRGLVVSSLKTNSDEVSLATTSGLGVNRVTPRAMMQILRGLRDELRKNDLKLSDILPVAGIDPGTLEDRYTDATERGSVVAKTGTLVRTDGGASALVGQMNTRSGRVVLFVIFNQRGNVSSFGGNQDAIVTAIQSAFGGPAPFAYQPIQLSMRLATSDYEAAKARGEYEPRN